MLVGPKHFWAIIPKMYETHLVLLHLFGWKDPYEERARQQGAWLQPQFWVLRHMAALLDHLTITLQKVCRKLNGGIQKRGRAAGKTSLESEGTIMGDWEEQTKLSLWSHPCSLTAFLNKLLQSPPYLTANRDNITVVLIFLAVDVWNQWAQYSLKIAWGYIKTCTNSNTVSPGNHKTTENITSWY